MNLIRSRWLHTVRRFMVFAAALVLFAASAVIASAAPVAGNFSPATSTSSMMPFISATVTGSSPTVLMKLNGAYVPATYAGTTVGYVVPISAPLLNGSVNLVELEMSDGTGSSTASWTFTVNTAPTQTSFSMAPPNGTSYTGSSWSTNWAPPGSTASATTRPSLTVAGASAGFSAGTHRLWLDGLPLTGLTNPAAGATSFNFYATGPAPDYRQPVNGTHLLVGAWNDMGGVTRFYRSQYTVNLSPGAIGGYPGGTLVDGPRPTIGAYVRGNAVSGVVQLSIDGAVVYSGSMALPAPRNYYQQFSFVPTADLAPGVHSASLLITTSSDLGPITSTPLNWSFDLQPTVPMTQLTSCEGSSCHPTLRASHPTSADCLSCHIDYDTNHEYGSCDTPGCHYIPYHPGTVAISGACTACHSSTTTHTAVSATVAHTSAGCDGCHAGSLTTVHEAYPDDTAFKYQCDTCHASADAGVISAIDANDTDCVSCHPTANHSAPHETTIPAGCSGTGCHAGTNLLPLHPAGCASCHESTDPNVIDAIATGDKDCAACHGTVDHGPLHDTTVPVGCSGVGCHNATNLVPLHSDDCVGCHASTDPNVVNAIATGDLTCVSCHPTQPADHEALHDTTVPVGCSGAGCHNATNLVPLHSDDCAGCHSSTDPNVVNAIGTGTLACSACHPTQPADHEALHDTTVPAGCSGTGCHNATNLTPLHPDCATCHASTDPDVVNAIATGNLACNACHPTTDHEAAHDTTVPVGCSGVGCHNATNLVPLHSDDCAGCHASTDPNVVNAIATGNLDCAACHGTVDHEPLHDTTVPAGCSGSGCHNATNLVPLHSDDCAGCHSSTDPAVIDAIATGNKDCFACHSTEVHDVDFSVAPVDRLVTCNRCHWVTGTHMYHNVGSNCGKCHKDGAGISFGFRAPTVSTAGGWFNTASGLQASASGLHSIHLNRTWLASWRLGRCASCHERAACSACHTDVGHEDHAYDEDSGTYASPPWSGPVATGTSVGDMSTSGLTVQTVTCTAQGCHDAAATPPVVVKDPGIYAADPVANSAWGPFAFTGYWRSVTASSLYVGDRVHDTASAGARMDASFVGTKVRIIGPKKLGYSGIADVLIDGTKVASVNAYSVPQLYNQVLWESDDLSEGPHTLRIVHTGQRLPGTSSNYFAFDCLEVLSAPRSFRPSCSNCH